MNIHHDGGTALPLLLNDDAFRNYKGLTLHSYILWQSYLLTTTKILWEGKTTTKKEEGKKG